VANVDSPVRASRDSSGESLIITADFPTLEPSRNETVVQKMWLVEVRGDRSTAFREIEGFLVPSDGRPHEVARTNAAFVDTEFPRGRLEELMSTMRAALIDDGLFDDEADALLNTWKISYFETPGLRLFFVLPRAWTDHVLPLKLSSDASIVRTMIGRVEIVTPHERQRLREIAAGPASKPSRPAQFTEPKAAHEPADFRAYRQLGRFRNALLLDELARRATPALQEFVTNYGLQGYQVVGAEQKSATN
jgi:hypothetical protein